MRILIDLDCVLADFIAGAAAAWGLTVPELDAERHPGVYGLSGATGRALVRRHGDQTHPTSCPCLPCALRDRDPPGAMTEGEWWSGINGSPDFWERLGPLPWARELVDLVREITDDWWVVTAPSRCDWSIVGKRRWCRRFFETDYFARLEPVTAKHLLAKPGVLLLDDCDANCETFVREGGEALTFPSHHNRLHRHKDDPMSFVRPVLERLRWCRPSIVSEV